MNNPDKQYTDLVNDAYKRYADSHTSPPSNPGGSLLSDNLYSVRPMTHSKESFIDKIKTDDEFAKTWGFQVYTKELSRRERSIYYYNNGNNDGVVEGSLDRPTFEENEVAHEWYNDRNVPKQVISFTYNNQTIEIYE